jgi:hypothetical protein
MLEPDSSGKAAHNIRNDQESLELWREAMIAFKQAEYLNNGRRAPTQKFYCKITPRAGADSYLVEGQFVGSRLTPDVNANRRLDVMRCKMRDGKALYMQQLPRSEEKVAVEVLRGNVTLIRYGVPWSSRVQSSLMSQPAGRSGAGKKGTIENPMASTFDPWRGFDASNPEAIMMDKIHMCVPGLDSPPSRKVTRDRDR